MRLAGWAGDPSEQEALATHRPRLGLGFPREQRPWWGDRQGLEVHKGERGGMGAHRGALGLRLDGNLGILSGCLHPVSPGDLTWPQQVGFLRGHLMGQVSPLPWACPDSPGCPPQLVLGAHSLCQGGLVWCTPARMGSMGRKPACEGSVGHTYLPIHLPTRLSNN